MPMLASQVLSIVQLYGAGVPGDQVDPARALRLHNGTAAREEVDEVVGEEGLLGARATRRQSQLQVCRWPGIASCRWRYRCSCCLLAGEDLDGGRAAVGWE